MKGILLAGGRGTRLRPITHTGPKQLVPIANKPVLSYAIDDLKQAGIEKIGVVLGNHGRKPIQKYLSDGSEFGVDITYIVQGNPIGIAHAVGCVQDFVGDDDFVVYLGDNILKQGIEDLVSSFRAGEYGAGIALQEVDSPSQFGIASVDEYNKVTDLVEKPDDPPSNLALIGIYVFSPAIFDVILDLEPSWRNELEITDAIQMLLDRGHDIESHVVEGWWKDTGKPEDILAANRLVLTGQRNRIDGTVRDNAIIQGQVDLHESATVGGDAVVRGPVSIAAGVEITGNSYIGPYTSIGAKSVIEGAHIENSVVIGESEISTDGRIVDSLIGQGTVIESAAGIRPDGRRLVIGETSNLKL